MYYDVAPEDLRLFWPGNEPRRQAKQHLDFLEKYWGFPAERVTDMAIREILYLPESAFGFAIWILQF